MKQKNTFYSKIILLFFSLIFSLLILEFGVRILSPMLPFGPYFDLKPYHKVKLYPNLKGVSSPAWHTANKWGMRGDDPPVNWEECFTILTIGGSTTQCYYLDDKKTWSYLLQKKLKPIYPKIWIGNAGIDGHTTLGHLLMMDKVVKRVKPDAIMFLVGINDLGLSLSGNIQANEFERIFMKRTSGFKLFLYEHSRLLQLAYLWEKILIDDVTVKLTSGHGNYIPTKMDAPENLPADLREMLPTLPNFRKNVISIINKAKELNIKVMFLTQPSLYGDSDYWSSMKAISYWLNKRKDSISAATEWRLLEIFNHELLRICAEHNVECFDLATQIPHSFEYFYDSCHFNEKGAELVASEIATYMISFDNY